MSKIVIHPENISKLYRLEGIALNTTSPAIKRWQVRFSGKYNSYVIVENSNWFSPEIIKARNKLKLKKYLSKSKNL